jgi:hypothetical protein
MFKCLGLSAPELTYSGLVSSMGTIFDVDYIPGFSGFLSLERAMRHDPWATGVRWYGTF